MDNIRSRIHSKVTGVNSLQHMIIVIIIVTVVVTGVDCYMELRHRHMILFIG